LIPASPEIHRIKRIIERSVSSLDLDLGGYSVLTEVGSNYFLFTPVIALMAGAAKVYAWTRDSRFGKGHDNVKNCNAIREAFNLPDHIEYAVNARPAEHVKRSDIITNLGFVRPLNEELLKDASPKAVIAGMCESWELRPNDIDLSYCRERRIPVAGTWENHPELKIFDGVGPLAVKLALNAGFEVYQNNIFVWSDDHFGEVISNAFRSFGARRVITSVDPGELYAASPELDFIFFCDYDEQRQILGPGGLLDASRLAGSGRPGVVHLYGAIDYEFVVTNGLCIYPPRNGQGSVMTETLAGLGPIPIINLHAAGLKVGELVLSGKSHELAQVVV
jgi:hypothetical protein